MAKSEKNITSISLQTFMGIKNAWTDAQLGIKIWRPALVIQVVSLYIVYSAYIVHNLLKSDPLQY